MECVRGNERRKIIIRKRVAEEKKREKEWSEAGTDISQFEIKKGRMEREWENLKISLDTKIWERVINKLQLK